MLEKLNAVANRYEELCAKSEQPDFYSDPQIYKMFFHTYFHIIHIFLHKKLPL